MSSFLSSSDREAPARHRVPRRTADTLGMRAKLRGQQQQLAKERREAASRSARNLLTDDEARQLEAYFRETERRLAAELAAVHHEVHLSDDPAVASDELELAEYERYEQQLQEYQLQDASPDSMDVDEDK